MKKEAELSVIICCYNAERRLPKVLDAILKQDRELIREIILVDNSSTDKTRACIEDYSGRYPHWNIRYVYEETQGLSAARKAGIIVCESEWIVFLDDDNIICGDWFRKIAGYIQARPEVGAFNGAIIPHPDRDFTRDENRRLKASLKVLACTHYDEVELKKNPRSPFRNPIGAGLVIRSAPMKKLVEKGWLVLRGRTADRLTSGEDGEMAYYVKECGYSFGFCSEAVLYHDIPRSRIDQNYLMRLWHECGRGVAAVMKKQGKLLLKRPVYECLLLGRLILYSIQDGYKAKYYREYIRGYHGDI